MHRPIGRSDHGRRGHTLGGMTQPDALPTPYKPKPTWLILTVAGVIVAGVITAASLLTPDRTPKGPPVADDVRIVECQRTDGVSSALVEVTNRGDRTRSYRVDVEFFAAGEVRVAAGVAYLRDVKPNQTAVERVLGNGEAATRCTIADATRN